LTAVLNSVRVLHHHRRSSRRASLVPQHRLRTLRQPGGCAGRGSIAQRLISNPAIKKSRLQLRGWHYAPPVRDGSGPIAPRHPWRARRLVPYPSAPTPPQVTGRSLQRVRVPPSDPGGNLGSARPTLNHISISPRRAPRSPTIIALPGSFITGVGAACVNRPCRKNQHKPKLSKRSSTAFASPNPAWGLCASVRQPVLSLLLLAAVLVSTTTVRPVTDGTTTCRAGVCVGSNRRELQCG